MNEEKIKKFIERLNIIHSNKYDYSLWVTYGGTSKDYHRKDTPVICPEHGLFLCSVANHMRGSGCKKCRTPRRSLDSYKREAVKKHNNQYDYSLWVERKNYNDVIPIICPKHGKFELPLASHISKKIGCPKCNKEMFVHPNALLDDVQRKLDDVKWLKKQHHQFKKSLIEISKELNVQDSTVGVYMKMRGIKTVRYPRSSYEKRICSILDFHNVSYLVNDRSILSSKQELDIVIPNKSIAIEICGLYYHSEQAGKDKHYHATKLLDANKAGYRLLTIFEDEILLNEDLVIKKILHVLGISNAHKIYGRNSNIITNINYYKRKTFFDKNHIQGNGRGTKNIGLEDCDGNLVALALFEETKSVYNLSRYATNCSVVGGFSKIIKAFTKEHSNKSLITYADLRWSDGKLYNDTEWKLIGQVPPTYFYSSGKNKRKHKFGYRHKNLKNKIKNYNPKLTERENCDNAGLYRIWDCGKLKFEYTKHLY